jgi:hypothetical protein
MLKNHRPAPLRRRGLQFLSREKNVKTTIDIEKFCDKVGTRNCREDTRSAHRPMDIVSQYAAMQSTELAASPRRASCDR